MRFLKHLRKRTAVVTLALALVITLFATQNAHAAGIVISTQPKAATVAVGATAKFTVVAAGSGTLTYQWQAYNPSTKKWVNSSSASAKTASLSLTAQAGHNGFMFRCLIKDSKGNQKYSDAATLTVTSAITAQPQPTSVSVGSIAKFTVAASGTGPFTYQWQAKSPTGNWVNSSAAGAKKATLGITASAAHNGYKFRCIVTDGNGKTLTSQEATLTVVPAIKVQPKPATVTVGSVAKFTVTASGKATLKYQWQAKSPSGNWVNSSSPSAKRAVFAITAQGAHNGYQFRCVVTDGNNKQAITTPATLTVNPAITTQPQDSEVNVGETAHFSIVAVGKGTLSYQWQAKSPSGSWTNSSVASATTASLSMTTIADHDGFSFRCIVTDVTGNQTISDTAVLTVKPVITTHPANATKAIGETVTFTVAAQGKNLTYQWQVLAPNGSWKAATGTGATTATLSVGSMTAALNGYKYRCIVTDGKQRTLTSNAALLKAKTTITTQPSDTIIDAGSSATFTIAATGAGLTYKWQYSSDQSNWTDASGATGTSFTYTPSGTATCYVRCVITDANNATATSRTAVITINYTTDILINETNFPDAAFRNWAAGRKIDTNRDGKLSPEEISKVTTISVYDKGITSMKGVEYFTSATSIDCSDNAITSLNVSMLTSLISLNCANNSLTSLDVSNLTALQSLACSGNQIRTLDVTKNTELDGLSCENNYLSSLNLSKNAKLTSLTCSYNALTSLNLSANPLMRELDCSYNLLTSLQLPANNVIYTMNCKQNHLTSINLSGASEVNTIDISNTDISSVDVRDCLSSLGSLTITWGTEVIGITAPNDPRVHPVDIELQYSITIPAP